jgi:uncharacterized membrane protein
MDFKVSRLDRPALIVTLAVSILLIGLATFFIIKVPFGWMFAVGMLAIILVCYLLSPKYYSLREGKLVIQKVIGKEISIPLEDVMAYTVVPDFTKLRVSRTFGNGGLFGYYGVFSTAEYGTISCQMRSLKDVIIIKTSHGAFALSPEQRARFEEHLVNTVKGLRGEIAPLAPTPPETIRQANPLILILPAAILILTVAMVFMLYPRLPERIAVHFDMQGNPDGWATRTSFMVSGLIPAVVLFILNTLIFFFVRRTTTRPTMPYLIVLLFTVFQLFASYVSLDTYWVNVHDHHLVPFPYNIIAYGLVIAVVLFFYYRKTRPST